MDLLESAELFAKRKHLKTDRIGWKHTQIEHLENVLNRLKRLGIIDKEILCASWLYETIEKTDTSFDELIEQFGTKTAVIVWVLTGNKSLSKKQKEKQYINQLKTASLEAKLIKLCDISDNLTDLKKQNASKSKRIRYIKQFRQELRVIEKELVESKTYPNSIMLLHTITRNINQLKPKKNSELIKKKS